MTNKKILQKLSNPIYNKNEIARRLNIPQSLLWSKINNYNRNSLNKEDFIKLGEIFKTV